MKLGWAILYLGVFLATTLSSLLLTPLAEKIGKRLSLMDAPGKAKIHRRVKARSGGLAIYFSFVISVLLGIGAAFFLMKSGLLAGDVSRLVENIPGISWKLAGVLGGASFLFVVGVIDDRITMRPWPKLLCQIASAIPLIIVGVRIEMFLPLWLGVALTIFWVVLLTNSFNFLDNMDGLTSGVAIIVCLILSYVSWRAGDMFVTALLLALAGSVVGFWRYNFFGSRLFMGDGGSLFIGYMIAALTIIATYYKRGVPTSLPVLTPLIVLGAPLFDTASVLLIRLKNKKPLMKGDTNHFSHRLVNLGMSRRQAVAFIYLVTLCVAITALPLAYLPLLPALIQTGQTALWFVLIFLLERAGKKELDNHKKT